MDHAASFPAGELARRILGFVDEEIAGAVQADETTLDRWRQGQVPAAVYLTRLERLDDLAREVRRTMRPEAIEGWLGRPIPALDGETPRGMIMRGRGEAMLGMLISFNGGLTL